MRKNPVTLGAVALSPLATQEKEREKTHLLDSLAVLGRGAYGGRCYFRGMSNIHWASLVLSGKRIQAGDSGPIPVHAQSCLTLCAPMDCSPRFLCLRDFPGKNTRAGCHFLFQGIFPTRGLNLFLLCLQYSCLGNPMDRGARQATVHGITRVITDLATKQQTTSTTSSHF